MASDGGDNSATPNAAQAAKAAEKAEKAMYEVVGRLATAGRGMYVALGKSIVQSSRRGQDVTTLNSQAKKYIAWLAESAKSAFGLSAQAKDAPLAVKCAFVSRIADDLLATVVDVRRRTCNTAILGGLDALGAIQEVLLTFEASAQLLWAQLAKAGDFGEKGAAAWELSHGLFDLLLSLTRFVEQIVNAQLLLAPTSSLQLMIQPVQGAVKPPAKDAESFVLALQQDVLDVVLPIWGHPLFAKSPAPFIESIFTIMTQIYSGVGDKKGQKISAGGVPAIPAPRPAALPLDEDAINMIVEMGFSRQRAEDALRHVRTNDVELALEWLFSHPEEPPAATAAGAGGSDEDELARALALSMGGIDTEVTDAGGPEKQEEEPPLEVPAVKDTLSMAVHLLVQAGEVAFSMTDLLVCLCNRKDGQDRKEVVAYLVEQLKVAKVSGDEGSLSTVAHVLALVMHEESNTRVHAAQAGLVDVVLELLAGFVERVKDADVLTSAPIEGTPKQAVHPPWVDALFLVLDGFSTNKMQLGEELDMGSAVPRATPAQNANPTQAANPNPNPTPGAAETGQDKKEEKTKESTMLSALCNAGGLLSSKQQAQAMTICCALLQQQLPLDAAQAVLQLTSHLSKSHKLAVQVGRWILLRSMLTNQRCWRWDPINQKSAPPSADFVAAS